MVRGELTSAVYNSGSWSPGDAVRNGEDHLSAVSHRCLPEGELTICLLLLYSAAHELLHNLHSVSQAFPLEVTKLIYCSRTVPEIEKVSLCYAGLLRGVTQDLNNTENGLFPRTLQHCSI